MYQYLSGYTAKIPGTELGIVEQTTTFSACFGKPFLTLHPMKYADILGKKMAEHGSQAYLVNTGWTGGSYGVGKRISLKDTRAIIDAILDGSIENVEWATLPIFNLKIPKSLANVDAKILNPTNTWESEEVYQKTASKLAQKFIENFKKYTQFESAKSLEQHGPAVLTNA